MVIRCLGTALTIGSIPTRGSRIMDLVIRGDKMFHWLRFIFHVERGVASLPNQNRITIIKQQRQEKLEAIPKIRKLIANSTGHDKRLHEENLKNIQEELGIKTEGR